MQKISQQPVDQLRQQKLLNLETQFPDITLIGLPENRFANEDLDHLQKFIQYCVPTAHYPEPLARFHEQLTDFYWGEVIFRKMTVESHDDDLSYKCADQVTEQSSFGSSETLSGEIQSTYGSQCSSKLPENFGIPENLDEFLKTQYFSFTQIKALLKEDQSNLPENRITHIIDQMESWNKTSFQWTSTCPKNQLKTKLTKNAKPKSKPDVPQSSKPEPTETLKIVLGKNENSEVRNIRQQLRTASKTNYLIVKEKEEEQLNEVAKAKISVNLLLNKITFEFFEDIYEEIVSMVSQPMSVWTHLVDLLIEKSKMEHNFIEVYAELSRRLCKIPSKKFAEAQKGKFNTFRRLLVAGMQQQLQQFIQTIGQGNEHVWRKGMKGFCLFVGSLIPNKILSKNIFKVCFVSMIDAYTTQALNLKSDQHENYIEGIFSILASIPKIYQKLSVESESRRAAFELEQLVEDLVQRKVRLIDFDFDHLPVCLYISLIKALNDKFQSDRKRVSCLIENFEEKEWQPKADSKVTSEKQVEVETTEKVKEACFNEAAVQVLSGKVDSSIYHTCGNKVEFLRSCLVEFTNCSKGDYQSRKDKILELVGEEYTLLEQALKIEILNLSFLDCDLPFLAEGIVQLLQNLVALNGVSIETFIGSLNQNQDSEDVDYFLQKVSRKLNTK